MYIINHCCFFIYLIKCEHCQVILAHYFYMNYIQLIIKFVFFLFSASSKLHLICSSVQSIGSLNFESLFILLMKFKCSLALSSLFIISLFLRQIEIFVCSIYLNLFLIQDQLFLLNNYLIFYHKTIDLYTQEQQKNQPLWLILDVI